MFEASFNATLARYRALVRNVQEGQVDLPNDNFDVGLETGPGKYRMNDEAHATLLDKLAAKNFVGAAPEVRAELLEFFADVHAPYATRRNSRLWARVQTELQQLRAVSTARDSADPGQPMPGRGSMVTIAP